MARIKSKRAIVYENGWKLIRLDYSFTENTAGPLWGIIDNQGNPATCGRRMYDEHEAIALALRLIAKRLWR